MLQNKTSILSDLYNQITLTIALFCLLLSIIEYISAFSQNSDSNFLQSNPRFPTVKKLPRFLLYFINSSISVCFIVPLISNISNYLQFRQLSFYNETLQKKNTDRLKKENEINKEKKIKLENQQRQDINNKLALLKNPISLEGSHVKNYKKKEKDINGKDKSPGYFSFVNITNNNKDKDNSPNYKNDDVSNKLEQYDIDNQNKEDNDEKHVSKDLNNSNDNKQQKNKFVKSQTIGITPTSQKRKNLKSSSLKKHNTLLNSINIDTQQIIKERIVVRHPETLANLSCVDSVLFAVDGVLTTGTYKIMAISSLKRNYFLDANPEENYLGFGEKDGIDGQSMADLNNSQFLEKSGMLNNADELSVLEYLRYKFDSDSKFYNSYKEKIESKEGNNGIKEGEIERYSEKSQEFERELDGDFIEQVFDEESEDSFAFIRNGDYNHLGMQMAKVGIEGSQMQLSSKSKAKKFTKKMARQSISDEDEDKIFEADDQNQFLRSKIINQKNPMVSEFGSYRLQQKNNLLTSLPNQLFSPKLPNADRQLKQMNLFGQTKAKESPNKALDITEENSIFNDHENSVDTVKIQKDTTNNAESKLENQIIQKMSNLEKKFKQKIQFAQNDDNLGLINMVATKKYNLSYDNDDANSLKFSEKSEKETEQILAKTFEVFDKKRLVYDLKEKDNYLSDLIEAIQFCHEKNTWNPSDNTTSNTLTKKGHSSPHSANSNEKSISENKRDVTILKFIEALCIDIKVKKNTEVSNYIKTYTVSEKIRKQAFTKKKLHNSDISNHTIADKSQFLTNQQNHEEPHEDMYDIVNSRQFNILGINPLNKRGRMSIIVNNPERGKLVFIMYVKGKYDAMVNCLNISKKDLISLSQLSRMYRNKGLKSVIYAMRCLTETEVLSYLDKIKKKQDNFLSTKRNSEKTTPQKKKPNNQEEELEEMEKGLTLLGCIGETKVIRQDSQDLIESLLSAGVGVNIASDLSLSETSDIAKRLNLLPQEHDINTFYLKENDIQQTLDNILNHLFRDMKAGQIAEMDLIAKEKEFYRETSRNINKNQLKSFNEENISFGSFDLTNLGFDVRSNRILLLSGKAFTKIMENSKMTQQLKLIIFLLNRVIGYELNNKTKAFLTQIIKKNSKSNIAAIGKGYIDLGMIAEANIGIQFSNSHFNVNFGDIVVGNLQVLKNLIFITSRETYKYNLSLILTFLSVNLLLGYTIWVNQFSLGYVFNILFEDFYYLYINVLVGVLCISQEAFSIKHNLGLKERTSFIKNYGYHSKKNEKEEKQKIENEKKNPYEVAQLGTDFSKIFKTKQETNLKNETSFDEDVYHKDYNKQLKTLDFIFHPCQHFPLYYKENSIINNIAIKYSIMFVVYNWILAIFIYCTAKIFVFRAIISSDGYNNSDFEPTIYIMLSILVVTIVRTANLAVFFKDDHKKQKQQLKEWALKLLILFGGSLVLFYLIYFTSGENFRLKQFFWHLSSQGSIIYTLVLSIGVPIFFDYVGYLLYNRLFLNPVKTIMQEHVFTLISRFSKNLEKLKKVGYEIVHRHVTRFRNSKFSLNYERLKDDMSKSKENEKVDSTIQKIFQIDNLSSSSEIQRFTLKILNSSKSKRYELYSKEAEKLISVRYFLLIWIVQSLKYICLLIIGFSGDQQNKFKFNLYLNTPIPYTVIIYGFWAYYLKKNSDKTKHSSMIPIIISIVAHLLIEFIISFAVEPGDRNNDLTEIEMLDVKLLSSPMSSSFIHFLILSPFIIVIKTMR